MNQITKHPGGAPTKYKQTYIQEVDNYLESCSRDQTQLASVEAFARRAKVNRDTIYEWSKKHSEFKEAVDKILARQKEQLMEDGFYGGKEVNANMGIFLLKVNHGMIPNENKISIQANEAKVLVVPSELIGKYGISQNTESSSTEPSEI